MAKPKSKKKRQVVDQRFFKALANPLRVEILAILVERVASPKELTQELKAKLPSVSYHVKVLEEYGLITLLKTEPRRGAVEHFYRATASTLLPAAQWRGIDGGLRTAIGAGLASELFDSLADAVEANKLTDADTHIGRMPLVLDAEGWEKVRASAERFTKEVEKEQGASAARVAKANGSADAVKSYTVGVLAFEDSRDLSKGKAKRVKGKAKTAGRSRAGKKRKAKTVG
ncbi:MAG TPA: winged helix-turn-helix domain-containing protein [Solirubrobacterales bacterium]|nr:winged helix-turn-helix domain-containing protein [Solirubrobacterales bacterium]